MQDMQQISSEFFWGLKQPKMSNPFCFMWAQGNDPRVDLKSYERLRKQKWSYAIDGNMETWRTISKWKAFVDTVGIKRDW